MAAHRASQIAASSAAPARLLPILRDGTTHFVAVRDIVAIHANAHYTTVFDGTSKLFCPLPIGEVEARLDHAHFVRVHRSHIVNLERVVGLKRSGDHGLIELSGHDPYTVPVSRSRFGGLKSQLGLGPREAGHLDLQFLALQHAAGGTSRCAADSQEINGSASHASAVLTQFVQGRAVHFVPPVAGS